MADSEARFSEYVETLVEVVEHDALCQPRDYVPLRFSAWVAPGTASMKSAMARFCRLDRGLGAGQRHGMGRQETCGSCAAEARKEFI
jgi:hypothetical protein